MTPFQIENATTDNLKCDSPYVNYTYEVHYQDTNGSEEIVVPTELYNDVIIYDEAIEQCTEYAIHVAIKNEIGGKRRSEPVFLRTDSEGKVCDYFA